MSAFIGSIIWLIVLLVIWEWGTPHVVRYNSFGRLFAYHLVMGLAVIMQVVYIQIVWFKRRQTDTLINQLVNEAEDEAEDAIRDPRDNTPYERIYPPRSPEI